MSCSGIMMAPINIPQILSSPAERGGVRLSFKDGFRISDLFPLEYDG